MQHVEKKGIMTEPPSWNCHQHTGEGHMPNLSGLSRRVKSWYYSKCIIMRCQFYRGSQSQLISRRALQENEKNAYVNNGQSELKENTNGT